MNIDKQVNQIVQQVVADITEQIQTQVMNTVARQISDIVSKVDYQALFKGALTNAIADNKFQFPNNSIPGPALDFSNFTLSGDYIAGGIIKQFGSTGIDDKATDCQLTIMDNMTVVENNLLTQDLTVKGSTIIEGDLNVLGHVPESTPFYKQLVTSVTSAVKYSLDDAVFSGYADMVLSQIKKDGLDLTKITIDGVEVINGSNLSDKITYSNLQRVGALRELQVIGEAVLSQTLYTTSKRVGINTLEPGQALTVWDQEVEIGMGKHGNNVGIIGTPRNQTIILSANAKNNITLTPDGGTAVNFLTLGTMMITSADAPPTKDLPKGTLVFNRNPTLGGPLGWVSLGDARWANFGYID